MTSQWVFNILLAVLTIVWVPSMAWIISQLIEHGRKIAELGAWKAGVETRCKDHRDWLEGIATATRRADRNIVKIGTKLDVDIEHE